MGEPAIPGDDERAETLAFARRVQDHVRNEEAIPHGENSTAALAALVVWQAALVTRLANEVRAVRTAWEMAEEHILTLRAEAAAVETLGGRR